MVTIISPHPDDAAFSIGGTIPQIAAPTRLVTVFGRSNYTLDGSPDDGDEDVTERRRDEDERFARLNDLRWTFLDLPSAGLRQQRTREDIFIADSDAAAIDADRRRWADIVDHAVFPDTDDLAPDLLLLPGGVGGHRDHLFLREHLRVAAHGRQIAVAFYEDLPYASRLTDSQIHAAVCSREPLGEVLVPIETLMDHKVTGIRCYQSQIDTDLVSLITSASSRYGIAAERFWTSCPATLRGALLPESHT